MIVELLKWNYKKYFWKPNAEMVEIKLNSSGKINPLYMVSYKLKFCLIACIFPRRASSWKQTLSLAKFQCIKYLKLKLKLTNNFLQSKNCWRKLVCFKLLQCGCVIVIGMEYCQYCFSTSALFHGKK